jgi:hypothetical protein
MKKIINRFFPLLIFIILTGIFFGNLFIPHLSIYFTPDLGRSDIVHHIFPIHYLFTRIISTYSIPLWTSQIGTGIPLLASGQFSIFNIVDYILLSFFSAAQSTNLLYVIFILISLLSTYGFVRCLKLSRSVSVFVSVVFSFSGVFIFRLQHLSVFTASCLLPLIFLLALKIINRNKIKDVLILAFVICQQIFIGHPQYVFITLTGVFSFAFCYLVLQKEKIGKKIIAITFLIMAISFGIILASAQIFPAIDFKSYSVRNQGLSFSEATTQSFSPKYFLTLIYPFIFGNPANASYQLFNQEGMDIFWEKAGYLGIIPLVLVFFEIFNKKKKSNYERATIFLLIISVLLVLGKYSPILFIYLFPPFNFFQIPARFLILLVFSLSILAGYGLETLHLKKINRSALRFLIIVFSFASSLFILYLYHPTIPVKDLLKPPESSNFLKNKPGRIYQIGGSWPYIKELQAQGWQDVSYYLFARNSLDADINLLYGNIQTGVYFALLTQREKLLQSLLVNEAKGDLINFTAISTPLHKKILNLTSTRFLITPFQFSDPDFILLRKILPPPTKTWPPFYIYENTKYLPRIRFIDNYLVAKDEEETLKIINSESFNPKTMSVIEGNLIKKSLEQSVNEITLVKDTDDELVINVKNSKENILILADSFYPGWQAFIDNKQTEIYPANINQRAIFVKGGQHQIRFHFISRSFDIGKKISLASFAIWIVLFTITIIKPGRSRLDSMDDNG